jgi:predicted Zn-dependent protease
MLLDQKKTKRMVRIVSVIAALGFVGALLPFLVIVIVQGGGTSVAEQQRNEIADAQTLTRETPKDPVAWADLADKLTLAQRASEAVAPARRAVALAPRQFRYVQILVDALTQSAQTEQAVQELQKFTRREPRNAEAFLRLGDLALGTGKYALARLSFQTVIGLEGEGTLLANQALQGLAQVEAAQNPTTTPTETTPERTTTTGPVTP